MAKKDDKYKGYSVKKDTSGKHPPITASLPPLEGNPKVKAVWTSNVICPICGHMYYAILDRNTNRVLVNECPRQDQHDLAIEQN